ncbi:hemerythrin domain-containing protein [Paenibacillus filicis]|uniref:Hemerythrin domain-containing protein n=1 Tax=Paenibacillus gyeongsangnamensis TaxID=3388067 RepID=A0ABT4QDD5_9BACL|nr:hemerythrin domain-containing protein [Paenibacillus filicis]MCZ8514791.1 hemerythrin domain-containing protein [Paenibacillus filicis]
MSLTKERHVLELDSVARYTPWWQSTKRLKEEHDALTERLDHMKALVKSVYDEKDPARSRITLKILKLRVNDFISALKEHSEWEERDVFPVIDLYFRRLMKPSITPSIWVMERDHELAVLFVNSFVDAVDALPEKSTLEQNRQTAAHLMQACLILSEHFELEEDLIYPLADEMLTDIDYFYS